MAGLCLFFGVVLALANAKLKVWEDPRIDDVAGKLPGANCGACGQPGCRAFAEQVVAGTLAPGKCTVSSAAIIADIAGLLGVDAGGEEKRVARLACGGGKSQVRDVADYRGLGSCSAAAVVAAGGRACPWGCLGLGDCARSCDFGAIAMNAEGLPVVDVGNCVACNDCVVACPLGLFSLKPLSAQILVQCSAPLTGPMARAMCKVACDACGRCALDAPAGAIEMVGGLPVVRVAGFADVLATLRCPTGAIQCVEAGQFAAPKRLAVSALSLGRPHVRAG
ncbi:MAG: Fe-S cluster protein [Deltaproteobacteria bacterium]|nr:Fe-S cluster protein [Deltaproteobacteria bacterium]